MGISEGEKAIGFELEANDGTIINIDSFKGGKNIVLCFYPKNHLYACQSKMVFEMAKSVISVYSEIESSNSVIFAISVDTVDSQQEFVREYEVPYLHLSDTKKDVCKKYAGLNIVGLAKRSTFIIDKEGIVQKIFRGFDVKNHGAEILEALKRLY